MRALDRARQSLNAYRLGGEAVVQALDGGASSDNFIVRTGSETYVLKVMRGVRLINYIFCFQGQ